MERIIRCTATRDPMCDMDLQPIVALVEALVMVVIVRILQNILLRQL